MPAGIVTALAKNPKHASMIQAAFYIAPHQPTDFSHPADIPGNQWSTELDWVSGDGWPILQLFNGYSENGMTNGIEDGNYVLRSPLNKGLGGHSVNTYLNEIADFFKDQGVPVTIIE